MKHTHLITILFLIVVYNLKSQNTIPTTTVTGALKINDSLNVNKDITAIGDITSKGEVISTDTMRAQKDVIVDGNAKIGGDLSIAGKSIFEQEVTIQKSLLFDGGKEISMTPATVTTKSRFYFGNTANKPLPWTPFCAQPNVITNYFTQIEVPGSFISRTPIGSGTNLTNSSLTMFSAPWDGNGFIEVEGVDNNGIGNNGLYLNHFCHRNTHINTNWDIANNVDGGTVYLGAKVDMQQSLRIGAAGSPISFNTSIEVDPSLQNNSNAIKVNTSNPSVKVLSVFRNDSKNTFVVYGDGKTQIGVGQPKVGGSAANAMLSVDGLILAKEVKIAIANTHWADYVFDKKYNLMSLKDLEIFISKNKHLPDVPSNTEVENNGIDVIEMNATLLKKVEELTLYLLEQNKRIEKLEKENATLNKKSK